MLKSRYMNAGKRSNQLKLLNTENYNKIKKYREKSSNLPTKNRYK